MNFIAVWIWQKAAWIEPQSVLSRAWLDIQAALIAGIIVVAWMTVRRRRVR